MDSFYGGRSGFSFVISKSYLSIAAMVKDFQKGPEFEAVHFNEYVLINTEDKNDKDNGKIFRRGYDYTNEMGGAQYVGTIVGPAGKAPHVELDTYKNIKDMPKEEGVQYRYSEGDWSVDNEALVPGKIDGGEEEDTFNDVIKWNCYSVRTPNNDDCTAYVGFQLPYPVIDFTAKSESPYYNRDSEEAGFTNTDLITREDDGAHPFFEQWHIAIPKGIKGDTFKNLRVVDAGDTEITIETYTGQEDDAENHRSVWVIDYEHYDKNETGEPVTQYVGDYNVIESIFIDDEGLIHLTYTHNDDETLNLKWLSGLDISEDGKITLHFAHGEDKVLEEPVVKWIDSVIIDTGETEGTGDQKFEITYNTGEKEKIGNPINYIIKAEVTEDFHLIVKYSDPEKRKQIQESGQNYKGPSGTGYHNELDWQDLGSVKDYDGILIGLNLTEAELGDKINSIEQTIEYLNEHYPNGLGYTVDEQGKAILEINGQTLYVDEEYTTNLAGKVVTVGLDKHGKLFYGFDYSLLNGKYKGWYYLGTLQLEIGHIIAVGEETESEKYEKLEPDGVWFRVEEKIVAPEG